MPPTLPVRGHAMISKARARSGASLARARGEAGTPHRRFPSLGISPAPGGDPPRFTEEGRPVSRAAHLVARGFP